MKRETRVIHKVSVREIVKSLGIVGDVQVCGFNQHQKVNEMMDREMTIVTVEAHEKGKKSPHRKGSKKGRSK